MSEEIWTSSKGNEYVLIPGAYDNGIITLFVDSEEEAFEAINWLRKSEKYETVTWEHYSELRMGHTVTAKAKRPPEQQPRSITIQYADGSTETFYAREEG